MQPRYPEADMLNAARTLRTLGNGRRLTILGQLAPVT